MQAEIYTLTDYNKRKENEHWVEMGWWPNTKEFTLFLQKSPNLGHENREKFQISILNQILPAVDEVAKTLPKGFKLSLNLSQDETRAFVSLQSDSTVRLWSYPADELEGRNLLNKLGALAAGQCPTEIQLHLCDQEDTAFMWKAASVHPLQKLENAYQRIAPSALGQFFIHDAAPPQLFSKSPLTADGGEHLAAVIMDHLNDGYYLFRLLIQYRAESTKEIKNENRIALNGYLTALLHNGDPQKMDWLYVWLEKKIVELGKAINNLNVGGERRVIFYLKGGRALNYFLGTPREGQNDWDSQVVINPHLSPETWYQCFREVHDVVLVLLTRFKEDFTAEVERNATLFANYLYTKARVGAEMDKGMDEIEDRYPEEVIAKEFLHNEAIGLADAVGPRGGLNNRPQRVNCKAELIDVVIRRRDSAAGLEEWTRLATDDGLVASHGVIYPHRAYYLNEYLMMIRNAYKPSPEDVEKAPKRISRFGRILASSGAARVEPSAGRAARLAALPKTNQALAKLRSYEGQQELYSIMISEMVEAYNLRQDKFLAEHFDDLCIRMMAADPDPPHGIREQLKEVAERAIATDVAVEHELSDLMDEHWRARDTFFKQKRELFDSFVRDLAQQAYEGLRKVGAQLTVAGSYAALMHAAHLRLKPDGLEPIRRILIKLHCCKGSNRSAVLNQVRDPVEKLAREAQALKLEVVEADNQSLLLRWTENVMIGEFKYKPLVIKIRVAEQTGKQLPVLASIDGLPLLDLRYLVTDYRKKTSKIDEQGARRVLASATTGTSLMLSRFDFDSDEP
jgi:hypothetical protein